MKMKDSGVEWIGEIPEGWEVTQVKNIFTIGRGRVIAQTELSENGKYPVYSSQTKENGCLGYINTYDFDVNQLTWTTDGANAGTVFLRSGKHNCTNVCGTLQLRDSNNELLFHKFALEYLTEFNKRADTNGYKIMNNEMAKIITLLPPKETQQKIANYLDEKCSQIEQTIQDQQQVIEKLKAYKQSLITEAVTGKVKIQNDKVAGKYEQYKDSGVEWIGEIPSGWEVAKFGRYAQVKSNLVDPNKYLDYPQVAPDNIEKGSGRLIDYKSVRESGVISWNHLFFKGQIVYSKIRPTLNKVIIAPFDGLCSADMYPIETEMDKQFFIYLMLSHFFVEQVGLITRDRVKMPKINQNELSRIMITIPTLEEQKAIAEYLDKTCATIDSAIEQKQKLIEKLTEYKKSLIYECVTGKKEI